MGVAAGECHVRYHLGYLTHHQHLGMGWELCWMHCHGEQGVQDAWHLMMYELCVWGFLSIAIRISKLVVNLRVLGRNQSLVWIDRMGVSLRNQRKGTSMVHKWNRD